MRFANRQNAAKQLAEKLDSYKDKSVVVYALPRGGVILGFEVADKLQAPLDLIITRKIGHPYNSEYAVCAITEDGEMVCNEIERASLDPGELSRELEKEKREARRRRKIYLGNKKHISAEGKTAIIIDDGIATGLTMFAAVKSLKKEHPKKIIVAVPVAPHDVIEKLKKEVDQVVTLKDGKDYFGSVGAYYRDFPQASDQEVIDLLNKSNPKAELS